MRTEPVPGRSYAMPLRVYGVRCCDYWRCGEVKRWGRGYAVLLQRIGTGEVRRVPLQRFKRVAVQSP